MSITPSSPPLPAWCAEAGITSDKYEMRDGNVCLKSCLDAVVERIPVASKPTGIRYPPGYVSTMGRRTEAEILADLDRRCGHTPSPGRILDPSLASPAPVGREQKASMDIVIPRKMRSGLPGGCGRNSKAKK